LILSAGQGYIDFRVGDVVTQAEEDISAKIEDNRLAQLANITSDPQQPKSLLTFLNKMERSHLIVWQVTANQ
jgi:hypothetical protein